MSKEKSKNTVTQELLRQRVIGENDLRTIDMSDSQLIEDLVKNGSITQELVALVTSNSLEIPFFEVSYDLIDWEKWEKYPVKDFGRFKCIPIFQTENRVLVVMSVPLEEKDQNRFIKLFGSTGTDFAIATNNIIPEILQNFYERLENNKKSSLVAFDDKDISVFIEDHIIKAMNLHAKSVEIKRLDQRILVYYHFANRIAIQEDHPYTVMWDAYLDLELKNKKKNIDISSKVINDKKVDFFISRSKNKDYIIIDLGEDSDSPTSVQWDKENFFDLPGGLYLLIHPDIWKIHQFAELILKKYSEKGFSSLVINNTHSRSSFFELSFSQFAQQPEIIKHIKPQVVYIENIIDPHLWSYVTAKYVFVAITSNNAIDAFMGAMTTIPPLYLSNSFVGMIPFSKIKMVCSCMQQLDIVNDMESFVGCKNCNFTGYDRTEIIYNIINIDKKMRKMVWKQPGYEEVETSISDSKCFLQKLSELLKRGEITPDDVTPFI